MGLSASSTLRHLCLTMSAECYGLVRLTALMSGSTDGVMLLFISSSVLSLVNMRENLTLKDGDDVILRVSYEQIGAINPVGRFAWAALWAGRRRWFYSSDTYYDGRLRSLGVKLGAAQQQPSETATCYLHQVHRHITWARFGTSGNSRLKRVAKRSVAPIYWQVQPILQAVSEVRSRYRSVKSNYGVGLLKQLAGCIAFTASFRTCPSSYFDYDLFLRKRWPLRKDYLYCDELWSLLAWLNAELGPRDAADLSDKRRFHDRASQAGLPIIPILAEFDGGTVRKRSPFDHSALDLFSKFADRWYGEGACIWQCVGDGSYCGDGGSSLTLDELYETLRDRSLEHPVILQPRVTNHRELQALSGKGLSTVRVVTMRDTSGRIEVAVACFRMAVGSLAADNFAIGGLASPVQLDDGRLGPAVFKVRPGIFKAHPDSGETIIGRTLPHWPEVKRIAVAAHEEFKTLPSIGWDIAITEDGPVIVEGNSQWGTDGVQMSHQKPLQATSIPACLAQHFDRLANAHNLPRLTGRFWNPSCARTQHTPTNPPKNSSARTPTVPF